MAVAIAWMIVRLVVAPGNRPVAIVMTLSLARFTDMLSDHFAKKRFIWHGV